MLPKNRLLSQLLVLVCLGLLSGCVASASASNMEGKIMNTSSWKTHCVGRYLIDLPPWAEAELKTTYDIFSSGAAEIAYMDGVKKEDLQKIVEQRVAALAKVTNKKTKSPMYIATKNLPNGGVAIVQWDTTVSSAMQKVECYFVSKGQRQYVFKYTPEASPKYLEDALQRCVTIAENLYSREPGEIPAMQGFCVPRGIVTLNQLKLTGISMFESSRLIFFFPEYPNASFVFYAKKIMNTPRKLLDQLDVEYILWGHKDKKVIRKGRHDAGPVYGEELCVSGVGRSGVTDYACNWGSPGKEDDLAHPHLSLNLETNSDKSRQSSFPNQAELLGVWDAIIKSIRLRPGAI